MPDAMKKLLLTLCILCAACGSRPVQDGYSSTQRKPLNPFVEMKDLNTRETWAVEYYNAQWQACQQPTVAHPATECRSDSETLGVYISILWDGKALLKEAEKAQADLLAEPVEQNANDPVKIAAFTKSVAAVHANLDLLNPAPPTNLRKN